MALIRITARDCPRLLAFVPHSLALPRGSSLDDGLVEKRYHLLDADYKVEDNKA
jgi:hypothetical protein